MELRDRQVEWQGETLLKPLYGNRVSGIEICARLWQRGSSVRGRNARRICCCSR